MTAIKKFGTDADDSIDTSLVFVPGYNEGMSAADIATVAQAILNDQNNLFPVVPGAFSAEGQLFIPNRGILKVLPGDVVIVDGTGWPLLLSKYAAANGPYTFT